jgi:hypothetical protein
MSSSYVRTQIKAFIAAELATENVIDLTAEYAELQDMLDDNGLTYTDSWLGIQFIGSEEIPINVGANNTSGCYREDGSVFLHVVAPATDSAASDLLTRAEALRTAFRGQRINDMIIEGVTPPNFEAGATLQFEAGFTSASVIVNYQRDLNL